MMDKKELVFNVFGIEFRRTLSAEELTTNLAELKRAAIEEVSESLLKMGFVIDEYKKCY